MIAPRAFLDQTKMFSKNIGPNKNLRASGTQTIISKKISRLRRGVPPHPGGGGGGSGHRPTETRPQGVLPKLKKICAGLPPFMLGHLGPLAAPTCCALGMGACCANWGRGAGGDL